MGCGGCSNKVNVNVPKVQQKTPRLNPDGALKFIEKPVPKVEGYDPDPDDEMKLIPRGPGCSYRITGIMLKKDGTYTAHHVCRHSKCEHKSKPVNFDICSGCPFRE